MHYRRWLAITLAVSAMSGCGFLPPGPPWEYPTVPVRGEVTVLGQPLVGGWIAFHPAGGTVGDQTVAVIDNQGKFQLDDCPIGKLQVRIDLNQAALAHVETVARQNPLIAPRLAGQLRQITGPGSVLRVHTSADRSNEFHFELFRANQDRSG